MNMTIDLHTHPQYKPFAHSYSAINQPGLPGSSSTLSSSLWHNDRPSIPDKLLNIFLSVTRFSQANFSASFQGRVMVQAMALGCVEKFFFKNKLGTSDLANLIDDFAAGFGRYRINTIEHMQDYWQDLLQEFQFVIKGQGQVVKVDDTYVRYQIVRNYPELNNYLTENKLPGAGATSQQPLTISIIPTIEGLHTLNSGLEQPCNPDAVLNHAKLLKQFPFKPWWVTFCHHFYNELCGHARSLRQEIGKITNQEEGIESGFTALGREVLHSLLDNSAHQRILIDIKHMSAPARREFLHRWKTDYQQSFPLIVSHGVANGLPTLGATQSLYPYLGDNFIVPLERKKGGNGQLKDHNQINFFDDEIRAIVESQGILGLQLDERRLANPKKIKTVKISLDRGKVREYRSALVWQQIQYVADMLDDHHLPAWDHLAIGSDYDGMVDPLNSFWTLEDFPALRHYLLKHAEIYFTARKKFKLAANAITPEELMQRIFSTNAQGFFQRWFSPLA